MIGRDIERVEIVIHILHFRAPRDGEAEPPEEVDQLVGGLGQGMAVTQAGTDAGQGDVEADVGRGTSRQRATWPFRKRLRGRS